LFQNGVSRDGAGGDTESRLRPPPVSILRARDWAGAGQIRESTTRQYGHDAVISISARSPSRKNAKAEALSNSLSDRSRRRPLIEEISLLQPRGHVFFRDVADVFADQGFYFELEAVLQHQLDFLLPGLFVQEPRILRDLPRPFDVLFVQFDLHAGAELAAAVIQTAQSQVARLGDCHAARFVGKIDRSLFEHAVDVIPPRVVIQQA